MRATSLSPEIFALVAVIGMPVSPTSFLSQGRLGRRIPMEAPVPRKSAGNLSDALSTISKRKIPKLKNKDEF